MTKVIGFVGIGVMGDGMVQNLLKNAYDVHVYTRTKSKAENVLNQGAKWCDSLQDLAQKCTIIITILGYPEDVREVYLGDNGLVDSATKGSILVDMTTSDPELSKEIYRKAREKDIATLDAPVSGGDVGAREARLSIMVGGDEHAYETALPVFEAMGRNIVYQGGAGSGQNTKMVNQIAISAGMLAVSEAMLFAKNAGLNPQTVLKSIEAGAAGSWTLSNLAPRMLDENFEPGFFIKHFIKDMQIAKDSSERMNINTPGLDMTIGLYKEAAKSGYAEKGTQAIYDFIRNKK